MACFVYQGEKRLQEHTLSDHEITSTSTSMRKGSEK